MNNSRKRTRSRAEESSDEGEDPKDAEMDLDTLTEYLTEPSTRNIESVSNNSGRPRRTASQATYTDDPYAYLEDDETA